MTKQKRLNHFVRTLNGKGRGIDKETKKGACKFVIPKHPGCSLGCQLGVRAAIKSAGMMYTADNLSFSMLRMKIKRIGELFKGEDDVFLDNMQYFHDEAVNWSGRWKKTINPRKLRGFCNENGLRMPSLKA